MDPLFGQRRIKSILRNLVYCGQYRSIRAVLKQQVPHEGRSILKLAHHVFDSGRFFFGVSTRLISALGISCFLHVLLFTVLSPGTGLGDVPSSGALQPIHAVLMNGKTGGVANDGSGASPQPAAIQDYIAPVTDQNARGARVESQPTGGAQAKSTTVTSREIVAPLSVETQLLPNVPGYVNGGGLSKLPRLLNEVTLEYPPAGGDRDGKVFLRILVGMSGTVDGIFVVKADPPGVFDDAAIRAFSRAVFAPGEVFGLPVKSQFFVEVEFLPTDRGNVAGRGY